MKQIMPSIGIPINLVDGAMEISRESTWELAQLFGTNKKLAILRNEGHHGYFDLYKVQGPFEITNQGHPIYKTKEFIRPELVAKLVFPQTAQICFDAKTKQPELFPIKIIDEDTLNNIAGYHIILPEEYYGKQDYLHTLITGEDVRKQLILWGIDDNQIKLAGIEKLL